jgi:DNA polymerase-3 subunit epsilon
VNAERLGFDLETTGVDPHTAKIVSWALVHRTPDARRPDLIRTGLVSGVEIPPDAQAIHGITTAFANTYGRPERDTVEHLCNEIAAAHRRGAPIVGMNLAYDLTLLDRRARALNVVNVCQRISHRWGHTCPSPVFDVYVLDLATDPSFKGSRRLGSLVARHLGRTHDNAHDAVADVIATIDLADMLVPRYAGLFGASEPGLVHAGQTGAYARYKQHLAATFRRLGRPGTFDECWPVCHHYRGASPLEPPPIEIGPVGRTLSWDDVPGRTRA